MARVLAQRIHTTRKGGRCRAALLAAASLSLLMAAPCFAASASGPGATRIVHRAGRIVQIPTSIPHQAGDMVDSRILPDLRWIDAHFPIYISDGYSGPLPGSGRHVGCDGCHTKGSDHHYGMAVDIVPTSFSNRCDASWRPITRLARWAEPRQNRPVHPFRWVGYDGDAGHGCGNHLHLSWNHGPADEYTLASWVEVLVTHPATGLPSGSASAGTRPKPRKGPPGGIKPIQTGGLST